MAGTAVAGELIAWPKKHGDVRFELATPADDAEVRRLLRENPMPGSVRISLEREPDASLAAEVEGDVHHTIVARDRGDGRLIAMGAVSVRERYLNGEPTRVGYLGQLRIDESFRNRRSVVLGGYAMLRELHASLGVKLYLTSIAANNFAARRLLERGLPGMPTYRPLCEFVTVVFRRRRNGDFHKVTARTRGTLRRRGLSLRHGSAELLDEAARVLNESAERSQLAPVWSGDELRELNSRGLCDTYFRIVYRGNKALACAAVWDQRTFKQTVVREYPQALRFTRLGLNALSPLTKTPRLPPVGRPFSHAFVSHVATTLDEPELVVPLVELLHGSAATSGVDSLVAGFDARDPRLPIVRKHFGGREYRTRLYGVHWPDGGAEAESLDPRPPVCPEVALL
jgi:hypothetical protein